MVSETELSISQTLYLVSGLLFTYAIFILASRTRFFPYEVAFARMLAGPGGVGQILLILGAGLARDAQLWAPRAAAIICVHPLLTLCIKWYYRGRGESEIIAGQDTYNTTAMSANDLFDLCVRAHYAIEATEGESLLDSDEDTSFIEYEGKRKGKISAAAEASCMYLCRREIRQRCSMDEPALWIFLKNWGSGWWLTG